MRFVRCAMALPGRRCYISLVSEMRSAMNPNKALWEKGDFTRIAASMRSSGEDFVDSLH
jgi:hypothetical protein